MKNNKLTLKNLQKEKRLSKWGAGFEQSIYLL